MSIEERGKASLRAAAVQLNCSEDRDANVASAERLIREAAAAGAEVRTDLPPQHHGARDHVSQRCLVLVEKDADEAAVRTRLERARAREVIAISQDWAKHCLLQQRVLPPTDFIFKPSSKR